MVISPTLFASLLKNNLVSCEPFESREKVWKTSLLHWCLQHSITSNTFFSKLAASVAGQRFHMRVKPSQLWYTHLSIHLLFLLDVSRWFSIVAAHFLTLPNSIYTVPLSLSATTTFVHLDTDSSDLWVISDLCTTGLHNIEYLRRQHHNVLWWFFDGNSSDRPQCIQFCFLSWVNYTKPSLCECKLYYRPSNSIWHCQDVRSRRSIVQQSLSV